MQSQVRNIDFHSGGKSQWRQENRKCQSFPSFQQRDHCPSLYFGYRIYKYPIHDCYSTSINSYKGFHHPSEGNKVSINYEPDNSYDKHAMFAGQNHLSILQLKLILGPKRRIRTFFSLKRSLHSLNHFGMSTYLGLLASFFIEKVFMLQVFEGFGNVNEN